MNDTVIRGDDRLHEGRVLVVERHQGISEMTMEALNACGLSCDFVSGLEGAVGALHDASEPYSLAVIDVAVSGVSAQEAVERLRSVDPGLPCILTAGILNEPSPEIAGTEYLQKPYRIADLIEVVVRALAAGSAVRQSGGTQ